LKNLEVGNIASGPVSHPNSMWGDYAFSSNNQWVNVGFIPHLPLANFGDEPFWKRSILEMTPRNADHEAIMVRSFSQ
jgi:hypothetical protein